ncbi:F-box protein At2g05970-like [Carex rostrata]
MSPQTSSSWANLLPDVVLSIMDHIDITTSIRLSAVCTSWASTIRHCLPSFPPMHRDPPVPWLLISAKNSNMNINRTDLTFYDLSTDSYFTIWIPIPSLCEHHWMCSYKGWLVTLDRQLQLHLIKPLTGAHVLLPGKGIEKEHPKKAIMCHSPDNTNELLIFCLTHQGCLVSTKLGPPCWTWKANSDMAYQDIILHQGKLYAFSMDYLCYWKIPNSSTKGKLGK